MSAAKTRAPRPVLPPRIHYMPGMRDPERAPTAPAPVPVPRPHLEAYFLPSAVVAPPVRGRGPSKRRLDPPRRELLDAADAAERAVRLEVTRWPNALSGAERFRILEPLNCMFGMLLRAGRR